MASNESQIKQESRNPKMISLYHILNGIFVFNVDDWSVLRKQHRIIGELVGNTNSIPKLPLKLHPEEVLLLTDLKCVRVLRRKHVEERNSVATHDDFANTLLEEQKKIYKNVRKRQLENFKDNILVAKRKKGDNRPIEEILEDELQKSCYKVSEDNMIWPIHNEPLNSNPECCEELQVDEIRKLTTNLKYLVFRDLWDRGYYITTGHKFGGDYLVYLGDPIAYHSIFIVKCVEDNKSTILPREIVAFGRLATTVKKKAVLASFDKNNEISYITINWMGE